MTRREELLKDVQYAIDNKIDMFFIKTKGFECKGNTLTVNPFCNFEKIKEEVPMYYDDNLNGLPLSKNGESYLKILSWGWFSLNEIKRIEDIILNNNLGEDFYD